MSFIIDGQTYEDEFQYVTSTIGLPAPEVKPEAEKPKGFLDRLSIVNPVKGMLNGPNWGEDAQIFKSVYEAFKHPGEVAQGKADPGDVGKAFDLAGIAVLGPAPVAKKMADGTLGSFAGVRSKTLDTPAYELAVGAEKQGFSADEIYKGTGFFKGAEGNWRYEIDDSGMKFFPENLKGGQKLLSDVLSHKELFDAYPELRNLKIREQSDLKDGASYSNGIIAIGPGALKDKSILMHEVQHAIQDIEGSARGGTPGRDSRDYKLKYDDAVNKLRPEILDLNSKKRRGDSLTQKEEARLDYLNEVFKKYNEYSNAAKSQAFDNYQAIAGEVEARNVQHRIDLTPSERMRFNPVNSEDIARANQIVRKQNSLATPYIKTHPYDGEKDFMTY